MVVAAEAVGGTSRGGLEEVVGGVELGGGEGMGKREEYG